MADVRDISERLWNGDASTAVHHPVTDQVREGQEILDRVLYYKGFASANTIDTGDGLVMLDTGAVFDTNALFESVRKWRPDARLAAAVFSHHHVDHIFGVGPFEREADERRWPHPSSTATPTSPATSTVTRRPAVGTPPSTSASSPSRPSASPGPPSSATPTSPTPTA